MTKRLALAQGADLDRLNRSALDLMLASLPVALWMALPPWVRRFYWKAGHDIKAGLRGWGRAKASCGNWKPESVMALIGSAAATDSARPFCARPLYGGKPPVMSRRLLIAVMPALGSCRRTAAVLGSTR